MTYLIHPCPKCQHRGPAVIKRLVGGREMYSIKCNACGLMGPETNSQYKSMEMWNLKADQ